MSDRTTKPGRIVRRLMNILFRTRPSDVLSDSPSSENHGRRLLYSNVEKNIEVITRMFDRTDDFVVRRINYNGRLEACVLFIEGAADAHDIANQAIEPIVAMLEHSGRTVDPVTRSARIDEVISAAKMTTAKTFQDISDAVVNGRLVILIPDDREARVAWLEGWKTRNIDQPTAEQTQGGPMDSFTEGLLDKISLIRRRIRSDRLRVEQIKLGETAHNPVAFMYLDSITRKEIVDEVRRRLQTIEIDSVIDVNYIKELILDEPWSPWPNFLVTERPDRTVAQILEGHVAIIIDGSPWALIVPITIDAFLQSPDDYYVHFYVSSFVRILRWFGAAIALLAPSLYVAVLTYHHELIPSGILFTILASRERLPLTPFVEALVMEGAFEILREAGLRMPTQTGPALSIVGVLVIGDAAVRAGIVSPLMIIVVGLTAISTFIIPSRDFNNVIRILRFPALVASGLLGLYGILIYLMFVMGLLLRMRSFGVPFLSPLIPLWKKGVVDSLVRGPWWEQKFRPWHVVKPDEVRSEPDGKEPAFGGPKVDD